MIDLKAVAVELHSARRARIAAELACSDIEELAEAIRQSRIVWAQQVTAHCPGRGSRCVH
jgi:hypothetical protein